MADELDELRKMREKIRKREREAKAKWRAAHPEKERAARERRKPKIAKYREENRDKINAYQREWRKAKKEGKPTKTKKKALSWDERKAAIIAKYGKGRNA